MFTLYHTQAEDTEEGVQVSFSFLPPSKPEAKSSVALYDEFLDYVEFNRENLPTDVRAVTPGLLFCTFL
jgi:hypothetical protein